MFSEGLTFLSVAIAIQVGKYDPTILPVGTSRAGVAVNCWANDGLNVMANGVTPRQDFIELDGWL